MDAECKIYIDEDKVNGRFVNSFNVDLLSGGDYILNFGDTLDDVYQAIASVCVNKEFLMSIVDVLQGEKTNHLLLQPNQIDSIWGSLDDYDDSDEFTPIWYTTPSKGGL